MHAPPGEFLSTLHSQPLTLDSSTLDFRLSTLGKTASVRRHEVGIKIAETVQHLDGRRKIPPVDVLDVEPEGRRVRRQAVENIHQDALR